MALYSAFFILPDLSSFGGITGIDMLKQAGLSLYLASGHLKWGTEVEEISFHKGPDVNFTYMYCSNADTLVKNAFLEMVKIRKMPSQTQAKLYPVKPSW